MLKPKYLFATLAVLVLCSVHVATAAPSASILRDILPEVNGTYSIGSLVNKFLNFFTVNLTTTNLTTTNATSTNATTTGTMSVGALRMNGDHVTDLTGAGLTVTGGALTLDSSGNWTGTFNGQVGSYYLNASNLTNFGVPFYTLFHATTTDALSEGSSNLYYTALRDIRYSTTSADYWETQQTSRSADDLSNNTTSDLAEGSHLYYTDERVNTLLNASSTIAKGLCATNEVLKWNGSVWVCGTDTTGNGNVATSTAETKGLLSYWTSTGSSPATLGAVATSSVSSGSGISISGSGAVVGSGLTITNSGLITASCSGGTSCSGTNPLLISSFSYPFPSNATTAAVTLGGLTVSGNTSLQAATATYLGTTGAFNQSGSATNTFGGGLQLPVFNVTGSGTSTILGNVWVTGNERLASTTSFYLNGKVVVDGYEFAKTGTGVKNAVLRAAALSSTLNACIPVEVPPGLYSFGAGDAINFNQGCVKLRGSGATSTIFQANGVSGGLIYDYLGGANPNGRQGIEIAGITFDVNSKSTVIGIAMGSSRDLYIHDTTVINSKDIWSVIVGAIGGTLGSESEQQVTDSASMNLRYINNTIASSTNGTAESFLCVNCRDFQVLSNHGYDLRQTPAFIAIYGYSTQGEVAYNTIASSTIDWLYTSDSDHLSIHHNHFASKTGSNTGGIQVINTAHSNFSYNHLYGYNNGASGSGGFTIYDFSSATDGHILHNATTTNVTFDHNDIHDSYDGFAMVTQAGAGHYDKYNIRFENNECFNVLWSCIDVGARSNTQLMKKIFITGNKNFGPLSVFSQGAYTVYGNTSDPTMISDFEISGNYSVKSTAGPSSGIYVQGASGGKIYNNNMEGTGRSGYDNVYLDTNTSGIFVSTMATTTGMSINGNFLVNAATSTIRNLSMFNSTTTNATTTGFASFSGALLANNASSTILNLTMLNSTTTNATTTGFAYFTGPFVVNNSSSTITNLNVKNSISSTTTIPSLVNAFSFATSLTATPIVSIDGSVTDGRLGVGKIPTTNFYVFKTTALDPASSGTGVTGLSRLTVNNGVSMDTGIFPNQPFGGWIQMYAASDETVSYPLVLQPVRNRVGIGTTTPMSVLQIAANMASTTWTDTSAGPNQKHWSVTSMRGTFRIATTSDAYASSTIPSFIIDGSRLDLKSSTGYVGIGTGTPTFFTSIQGDVFMSQSATTSGMLVVGNPTAVAFATGTINAQAVYDDAVLIAAPDYVFDDPSYMHLSWQEVKDFVQQHAYLPWVTGRKQLKEKAVSTGQRINQVLESIENLWGYIQQLFEHDKEQDTEINELKRENAELRANQEKMQKAIEQLQVKSKNK